MDENVDVSPAIIVQGGWFALNTNPDIYKEVTERAARVGYDTLMNDGTAVDAVEKAIRVFEEHNDFNAGRGSCLNTSGGVKCDAMIMDGHNMKTGAVISARHFPHPVSIARKIMEESPHCALSGEGALEFALSLGNFNEICTPKDLKGDDCPYQTFHITNPEFETFSELMYTGGPICETPNQQARDNAGAVASEQSLGETQEQQGHDTVNAVAMDRNGYLACANSSGGMPGKLKGRVSDASIVGCGAYANEFGAAATNGRAESIMKMTLAREAVYNMERGQSAQEAAENAVRRMKRVNACSGVIAIGKHGDFGIAFNTFEAVWARMKNNKLESGMRLGKYKTVENL